MKAGWLLQGYSPSGNGGDLPGKLPTRADRVIAH